MRKTAGRENKPDLFILDTSANAECQSGKILTSGSILRSEGRNPTCQRRYLCIFGRTASQPSVS
jgi:hypothetical protein